MPEFKTSVNLNAELERLLARDARSDFKKKADLWVPFHPEKLNDQISSFEKWGLMQQMRDGWAVGYYRHPTMTGSFIFFDKTEDEVMKIMTDAESRPPKIPVKGATLEKMVALRIVRLAKIIEGMYETNTRNVGLNNNAALMAQNSRYRYPTLTQQPKLGEIKTVQDLVDLVNTINIDKQLLPYLGIDHFSEIIEKFIHQPNLTDEIVAKGYGIASVELVTKE